jgi:hypothetical protein
MIIAAWFLALATGATDPHLYQTQQECLRAMSKLHGVRCFQAEVILTNGLVFPPDQRLWWKTPSV